MASPTLCIFNAELSCACFLQDVLYAANKNGNIKVVFAIESARSASRPMDESHMALLRMAMVGDAHLYGMQPQSFDGLHDHLQQILGI